MSRTRYRRSKTQTNNSPANVLTSSASTKAPEATIAIPNSTSNSSSSSATVSNKLKRTFASIATPVEEINKRLQRMTKEKSADIGADTDVEDNEESKPISLSELHAEKKAAEKIHLKEFQISSLNFQQGVIHPTAFFSSKTGITVQSPNKAPCQYLYTTLSDSSQLLDSYDSSLSTERLGKTPTPSIPTQPLEPESSPSQYEPVLCLADFESQHTPPASPLPDLGYATTDGDTTPSTHSSPVGPSTMLRRR